MKPFYKSKTVLFNGLAFLLAVALPVLGTYGYTGEVPAAWAVFIVPAIALVNIILRFVTKEPIA
jgi:VIT1/CCC1 family predicted Fe2+/Mn2+ transporter